MTDFNTLITGEGKKIRLWDFRGALNKPVIEFSPKSYKKIDIPDKWITGKTVTGCTKLQFIKEYNTIVANFTGGNGLFTFDLWACTPIDYYKFHYYSVSDYSVGEEFLSHIAVSVGAT